MNREQAHAAVMRRIEECSSGEIVHAANTIRNTSAPSAEAGVRLVVLAFLFSDGWLDELLDMVREG